MKLLRHGRRAHPLRAVLSIACFSHVVAAQTTTFSIPKGQEELALDMLGRGQELPDGCTLGGVSIDQDVIVATYACGERRPVIELRHPQTQSDGLRTAKFLVIATGDSVPGLLPRLASVIERHEASFHWAATQPPKDPELGRAPLSSLAPNRSTAVSSGLIGLAIALAIVAWAAWRERRLERPQRG